MAFQALALTFDASERGSNDLEMGSIWLFTRLKAMITLKVMMVLKLYSCVTYFQVRDTISVLIGSICKPLQLGYDSVYGNIGEDLNYEEQVVYKSVAVLPRYIIVYQ